MRVFLLLITLFPFTAHAEILAVPHPASPLDHERTVIWSPLFQATWDKLTQETGPLIQVTPPNPLISQLADFKWEAEKTMPDGSWKTWSGPTQPDFVDAVNKEAAAITKEPEGPFKLLAQRPLGVVAFGLLDREVEFEKELYRSKTVPLAFKTGDKETQIAFFGTKGSTGFVEVLSWQPEQKSHAVRIRCKDPADSVVLWLPPAKTHFDAACLQLKDWISGYSGDHLTGLDQLRIPYVELSAESRFAPEMQGTIDFERKKAMLIVQADQLTRFKLHEKGARVRSEVTISADPFGPAPKPPAPPPPRDFIYDRPFFVFLWKKDAAWPYFGAWVGDTEAMEQWKTPAPR